MGPTRNQLGPTYEPTHTTIQVDAALTVARVAYLDAEQAGDLEKANLYLETLNALLDERPHTR